MDSYKLCDEGEIITQIYGKSDKHIMRFGAKCSDGTDLEYVGDEDGAQFIYENASGWKEINVNNDEYLKGLIDIGNLQKSTLIRCPDNEFINGYTGTISDGKIADFNVFCGKHKQPEAFRSRAKDSHTFDLSSKFSVMFYCILLIIIVAIVASLASSTLQNSKKLNETLSQTLLTSQ
jgi:hypothetical protein